MRVTPRIEGWMKVRRWVALALLVFVVFVVLKVVAGVWVEG